LVSGHTFDNYHHNLYKRFPGASRWGGKSSEKKGCSSRRSTDTQLRQVCFHVVTDGFEDSHAHTNVNVWIFSWSFHTRKCLRTLSGHVLCCSAPSTLVPVASITGILRSSWPWGLENLLAPPQALQVVTACTVLYCQWEGCACLIATPHNTVTNTPSP
jgi:hypothetical protein